MPKELDINDIADVLGVTPTTLRRWDANGLFPAQRESSTSHRFYYEADLENFLRENYKYLNSVATRWAYAPASKIGYVPPRFYCSDSSIFKARLSRLESELQLDPALKDSFSLVTSLVAEIGNNSFDHNIGNWPDMPGIFFGYDLSKRKIILADRGRGVLATLKSVRSSLSNDKDALNVAFTEVVSGRSLEARGNGLKYVKKVVTEYAMSLWFESGEAAAIIDNHLDIVHVGHNFKGCFVILDYKNL